MYSLSVNLQMLHCNFESLKEQQAFDLDLSVEALILVTECVWQVGKT